MTPVTTSSCYLFGIVPAGSSVPGWQDEAMVRSLRLITVGDVAALVGDVAEETALGTASGLRMHDRVVADMVAAGIDVVPARFGTLLPSDDSIIDEVLVPERERFETALASIRGCVQYTLTARYEQDAVLRDIVAEHPDVAELRGGAEDDLGRQMRLGELVVAALRSRRERDAPEVLTALEPVTVEVRTQEPDAPEQLVHAACLVERRNSGRFEDALEEIGRRTVGRFRLRLVGPVAPYDFVPEA